MTLEYLPVLTIAGSDSSGGAGIQADLKTFTVHGCYGASVTTALTAQNTTGVQAVHGVPPDFVMQQMSSVLDDVDVKAIKTGMLVDPVCVSTSGHVLLHPDAVDTLIDELFPLSDLITPNKAEAELLLKQRNLPSHIASLEDMINAARRLRTFGSQAVLLKGGHCIVSLEDVANVSSDNAQVIRDGLLDETSNILRIHGGNEQHVGSLAVDVLCTSDGRVTIFARTRLESTSTHGTGCTLSAALACQLARGIPVTEAVRLAAAYTHIGIETANPIGSGFGPLNHVHSIAPCLIAPRTKTNPYPLTSSLIRSSRVIWKEYVQHEFVVLLGKGTLPKENFLHFIKLSVSQYYARAYALLAAKSHEFAPILAAIDVVFSIIRESSMHIGYCAEWESPSLTAYGAFLIDAGLQGDPMKLMVALAAAAACLEEARAPNSWVQWEGNPYLKWMEDYSGDEYQKAVKAGLEMLESRAAADAPSLIRLADWKDVWERCTRLEKGFWDMAMNLD
ncbi:Ribokinase-like protein [Suillus ampliporus]|nr:Ribokinase-like protein [Suillus ampliporus]